MTNYFNRASMLDCPDCGDSMTVVLKREARRFKYWHACNDKEDCGFESNTRVAPTGDTFVSDDQMDAHGVEDAEDPIHHDELAHVIADATSDHADENPAF